MIVFLDDVPLLVATIQAHLFAPIHQRAENAQLLRREHVPGLHEAGHDRVVCLADLEAEPAVSVDQ